MRTQRTRVVRWTLAALALAAAVLSLPAQAMAAKKIVIVSWNQSEPRYSAAAKEMIAQLGKEGIGAGDYSVEILDAKGKKDVAEQLAKDAHAKGADIYSALGTSALVPLSKEIKDKPIVFAVVYDPVGAGIAKDWASSGNNTTGGSNFVSISAFLHRLVKRSSLKVKTVQVLYTAGEKNSELELAEVRAGEQDLGITVAPVSVKSAEDVAKWAKDLAKDKPDMLVLTGSNAVGTHIAPISDAALKNKIMTVTHLEDIVQRGALYGLVADITQVAQIAGKDLAQVIRGANPSSIRIEYPLPKLIINDKTASAGGFTIPDTLKEWASGNASR